MSDDNMIRLEVIGSEGTNQYVLRRLIDMNELALEVDPAHRLGEMVLAHINEVRELQGLEPIE